MVYKKSQGDPRTGLETSDKVTVNGLLWLLCVESILIGEGQSGEHRQPFHLVLPQAGEVQSPLRVCFLAPRVTEAALCCYFMTLSELLQSSWKLNNAARTKTIYF